MSSKRLTFLTFGEIVRAYRRDFYGYSISKFAQCTNVSRNSVYAWEEIGSLIDDYGFKIPKPLHENPNEAINLFFKSLFYDDVEGLPIGVKHVHVGRRLYDWLNVKNITQEEISEKVWNTSDTSELKIVLRNYETTAKRVFDNILNYLNFTEEEFYATPVPDLADTDEINEDQEMYGEKTMTYQKLFDGNKVLLYIKNDVHYQLNKETNLLQYEAIDSGGKRVWKDVETKETSRSEV